jgi:hypothetical protein
VGRRRHAEYVVRRHHVAWLAAPASVRTGPVTSRVVEIDAMGLLFHLEIAESTGGNVGAVEIRIFAPPG